MGLVWGVAGGCLLAHFVLHLLRRFFSWRAYRRARKRIRSLYPAPSAAAASLRNAAMWAIYVLTKPRGFGGTGWLDGMLVFCFIFGAVILAGLIWHP